MRVRKAWGNLSPDEQTAFLNAVVALKEHDGSLVPNYDDFAALTNSLQRIREHPEHQVMLSSWTKPAFGGVEFMELLSAGEKYLQLINKTVKDHYRDRQSASMDDCAAVIHALGLPPVYVNPIVHNAFLSHL